MPKPKPSIELPTEQITPILTAPIAPKFPIARLLEDCRVIFGVSESTFIGATTGLTGEYTKDEMAAIIKQWQAKPLCHKGGKS